MIIFNNLDIKRNNLNSITNITIYIIIIINIVFSFIIIINIIFSILKNNKNDNIKRTKIIYLPV